MFQTIKLIIVLTSLLLATSLTAGTDCNCNRGKLVLEGCKASKAKEPSWWGWLTTNRSSQLHFFQLIELLHSQQEPMQDKTAANNDADKDNMS